MNQPQSAPMQAQPASSGLAIASLVCGICGLFVFGPLTGIPAVITGHIALSKIKKSGGIIHGRGMAIAGLILGYISIVLTLLLIIILIDIAIDRCGNPIKWRTS